MSAGVASDGGGFGVLFRASVAKQTRPRPGGLWRAAAERPDACDPRARFPANGKKIRLSVTHA
jgi:hypothetical protein